jgi:hypothetical protein
VYLPYLLIVLLLLVGVGGVALGGFFVAIPAFVLMLIVAGFVLSGRGTREQQKRRAGTHEVPSSAEASAPAPVDPSQPVGGTLGDASE